MMNFQAKLSLKNKCAILGTLLWIPLIVSSQNKVLLLNSVSKENGLSQSRNEFFFNDQFNYAWIASLDGLNQFDGKEVKVFKPNDRIQSSLKGIVQSNFFELENGDIWFSTSEAVCRFNRGTNSFTNLKLNKGEEKKRHYAFAIENNRYLWIGSEPNLYKLDIKPDNDNFSEECILSNFNPIRCSTIKDTTGKIRLIINAFWTEKDGFEIISFDDEGKFKSRSEWFVEIGKPENFTLEVFQVFVDSNNDIWFETNLGILNFEYNEHYTNYKLIPQTDVKFITNYNSDYLLLLSHDSKLAFYDKKSQEINQEKISLLDINSNEIIENIDQMFSQGDSILWFSSYGKGLFWCNLKGRGFHSLFSENSLNIKPVDFIGKNSKDTLVLYNKKGSSWGFNKKMNLIFEEPVSNYSKQIIDKNQRIWKISVQGLTCLENGKVTLFIPREHFSNAFLYCIEDLNEHFFSIGTNQGWFIIDKRAPDVKLKGFSSDFVIGLFKDSENRIWVADANNIVKVWDFLPNSLEQLIPIDSFYNFDFIHHITEDTSRNTIWSATSKGLLKINSNNLQNHQWITEADGLPNQFIYAILFDDNNELWLSSNKGIIHYRPDSIPEKRFKQYTSRDGLSSDEYMPGSALRADDGYLWFGSTKGVDVFHPDEIRTIGKPPKLAINSLKIHDKEWVDEENHIAINFQESIVLHHTQNTLTFELAALEYTDPVRNQFEVYLTHQGKTDTTFLGTKNTITFANLAHGDYDFSFLACNAEGLWQETLHELKIFIKPPYYETWWFRIAAVLFLTALVSFISALYYRSKSREKQLVLEKQARKADLERVALEQKLFMEQERSRIAGEMHDEIGSGLSTIRNATAKGIRKKSVDDMKHILTRVSQISIGLINNMQGIIWAMDPDNDSLEDLSAFIRRYTREYLEDNDLQAAINIPFDLPDVMLNGKTRHNIMLIVKESLHNVVKHAQASKVSLDLKINKNLEIIIKDDGIGFDETTLKKRGHGLKSMHRRAKNLNGELHWQQLKPSGTGVLVSVPIQ